MNFVEYFPKLSKFKISNVEISRDKISNLVYIDFTHKIPHHYTKIASTVFKGYHNLEFDIDGLKSIFYVYGWGDDKCKTILTRIVIFPEAYRTLNF